MAANPVVLSMSEPDTPSREDSLIDRDSDIFNTLMMVSPVSVSKENLLNNVGFHISFLEAARASFTLYVIETIFPFPEFVSWCAERYSQGKRDILNKLGSEVLCKVDGPSLRHALNIPDASPIVL
jgi:hypothetical protein